MKKTAFNYFLAVLILVSSCKQEPENKKNVVMVFCAAGLTDVIAVLSDSFAVKNDAVIKLNMASSGTLARQIEQGNHPDIYISASKRWADYIDSMGGFSKRKLLYRNKLVMITPKNSKTDSINFSRSHPPEFHGYLSMGDPSHVPAGKYAREALVSLGWWDEIKQKTLPAKDVRSAVIPVELKECEFGIVYYSDAITTTKVKIAGIFPDSTHTPILFHALLSNTANSNAKEFYRFLNNPENTNIWIKHGLTPVPSLN
ncbi:MAG: molybdate ABC transporter substrate-binding protein [Bacteroidales bacterium]|jgi:molybdate transport system substrate-binding protein